MSWDFGMIANLGGKHPTDLPYSASYTYNVSKMFYDALECEEGIRGLDNKSGKECKLILEKGIRKFIKKHKLYKSWNPENGWGNYDSALDLLRTLLSWCEEAPNAIMRVT